VLELASGQGNGGHTGVPGKDAFPQAAILQLNR
jgi:hypothetical protein